MYLIDKQSELTTDYLSKVISAFRGKEKPKEEHWRKYYDGKQEILNKVATDIGKPSNKIVVNYCYNIVQNYLGYITGTPIKYTNDDFKEVIDILNYNDVTNEDNEYLRTALIFGRAFEVAYIDEMGKQRFRLFDPRECIPVYSNDLNKELLYVVRFYEEDPFEYPQSEVTKYYVEVYGPNSVKYYRSWSNFTTFEFIEERPHFYNQCPVTVFSLNVDEKCIFDQIESLQDAYNRLLSDEVDDFDAFCDAYLLLKGVVADAEDLAAMKQNRVLMVDTDADANYLTKSVSDTQIENMLKNVNDQIYKISGCPDFNNEKFMAQSGIALKYKIINFENAASNIETNMRKALQRRIELICGILKLTTEEQLWRDVEIIFTRNLPIEVTPSTPQEVMQYKGLVSNQTLLSLLPFIKDVNEEMKLVDSEKESEADLYGFNFTKVDSEGNGQDTE